MYIKHTLINVFKQVENCMITMFCLVKILAEKPPYGLEIEAKTMQIFIISILMECKTGDEYVTAVISVTNTCLPLTHLFYIIKKHPTYLYI